MLAQKYRFHGHGSLRYVYKNGDQIRGRQISLKYIRNPTREYPRISVVVSKKVLKSAVGRNRIRRRIYEAIRIYLPEFNTTFDVVIMVFSSEVIAMPSVELEQLLRTQLSEAGIITENPASQQ